MEQHKITLEKMSQRALQSRAVENNITALLGTANNKSLASIGWTVSRDTERHEVGWHGVLMGDTNKNTMYLLVTHDKEGKTPGKHDLAGICKRIAERSPQAPFGKWTLATVDGKPFEMVTGSVEPTLAEGMVGYVEVEVPDNFESEFEHLYGLDHHIARVRAALEAGILSDWQHRPHCALIGPPGCGKSDLAQSLKRALGEDAVMEYDATAMTSAGAIKDLDEREILPRVLIVEEIEKTDEKSLSFLLAVMDMRAEIRKVTARKNIQKETKLFVVATVNNYELFCKLQAGALASRFSGNKIGFNRPSREQLAMILKREIDKVHGKEDWIAPTLNYCEENMITDPREVISICVCGRDKLLTGEYQKMLEATNVDQRNEVADWTSLGIETESE